jgi:hypothetical protein
VRGQAAALPVAHAPGTMKTRAAVGGRPALHPFSEKLKRQKRTKEHRARVRRENGRLASLRTQKGNNLFSATPAFRDSSPSSSSARLPTPLTHAPAAARSCAHPHHRRDAQPLGERRCRLPATEGTRRTCGAGAGSRPISRSSSRKRASSRCTCFLDLPYSRFRFLNSAAHVAFHKERKKKFILSPLKGEEPVA